MITLLRLTVYDTAIWQVDKYGRVIVGGSTHTVGMAGYTLGGGHSPICRYYGMAIDNLLEVEMVMADGRIVTSTHSTTMEAPLTSVMRISSGQWQVVGVVLLVSRPDCYSSSIHRQRKLSKLSSFIRYIRFIRRMSSRRCPKRLSYCLPTICQMNGEGTCCLMEQLMRTFHVDM